MLNFLFRRLTAEPARGAALFAALTAQARLPHWYVEGKVPDTLDGRFAVLSSLIALALLRLERDEDSGNPISVALTERFIEVMESEHRELGMGDPTLGRTVRKLVSILAKRTELWRSASKEEGDWIKATLESLYRGEVAQEALAHSAEALRKLVERLAARSLVELEQGMIE